MACSRVGKEENLLGKEHAKANRNVGAIMFYNLTLDTLVSFGTVGKISFPT